MKALRGLAFLAFLTGLSSASATPRNVNDVYVHGDSEAVREIYARQAGNDPHGLMVARAMLSLAQEERAVKALDRHLAELAHLMLQGKPLPAGGTIRQLVDGSDTASSSPDAANAALLSSSLHGKFTGIGPAQVQLEIANATAATIRQFDARMYLRGAEDLMVCRPLRQTQADLAPGQDEPHVCEPFGNRAFIQERLKQFEAQHAVGAPVKIAATRINFRQPAVSVTSHGVFWLDEGRAHEEASATLRAMDCERRAACAEELKRKLYANPQYLFGMAGMAAGFVAGLLIGVSGVRRARAVGVASVLAIVVAAAGVGVFASRAPSGGGIVSLVLAFLALLAVVAFLATLWVTVAVVGAFTPPVRRL